MGKKKINKSTLIPISLSLSMVFCFVISIPFSVFLLLPLFEKLDPDPNKLVVFLVVLPIFIIIGIIFGYIGIFFCLLIWKPLLTKKDIDEILLDFIYGKQGKGWKMTVRDRLAAIALFKNCTMTKTSEQNINVNQSTGPVIGLPPRREDPALKIVDGGKNKKEKKEKIVPIDASKKTEGK